MLALEPFWPGGPLAHARFDPVAAVAIAASAFLYAAGVRRLAARGRTWPLARSSAFGAGLAALAVATQSGVGAASDTWYSVHVVEHLLIGMVAPLLLAAGGPVTLAVQAGGRRAQLAIVEVLRMPVLRWARRPVPVLVVFAVTLAVMNLPSVVAAGRDHDPVHLLLHLHAFVAGLAFAVLVTGADPEAWRVPPPVRLGIAFLTIPAHAFVAMAVLGVGVGLADAAVLGEAAAQSDQRLGAALLWIGGDLVGLVVTLLAAVGWFRLDQREARRLDRRSPRWPVEPSPPVGDRIGTTGSVAR